MSRTMSDRFGIELGDVPDHYAALHPQRMAVVYPDGESITWSDLAARSNARAAVLRSMGVRPGDMVTIALPNSCDYYTYSFAVWKLGATPNFVSHKLPPNEIASICALASPRVVIGDIAMAGPGMQVLSPDLLCDTAFGARIAAVTPRYWKAATSGGSTGVPKIIVDRRPFNPASMTAPDPGSSFIAPGPLYHNAPFMGSHVALARGCLVAGMRRFDAEQTLRMIDQYAIEHVSLVPTMMHRIWTLPDEVKRRYRLDSVRKVWHYGAPIAPWLKERWIDWLGAEKIWEFYGSTEYLGATAIRGDEWLARKGSVGRLVGGGAMKVLRPDGGECPPGEVGELYFLPPDPAQRPYHYVGAQSRTAEGGWESVGDMGYVDGDGYLFLADRRVDLILRGGANIYPAEIEAAIDAFPGVRASLVVGLRHEDLGEVPHAIVEVVDARSFAAPAMVAHLRSHLAPYKLPATLEIVETGLKDDAGKARRVAVRDERRAWVAEGRHLDRFIAVHHA